jgi:hypothetical protein
MINLDLYMSNSISLVNCPPIGTIYNDAPEPWRISLQDGTSAVFKGITGLHSSIFFYLVIIFVGVGWMLGSVVETPALTLHLSRTNTLTAVHLLN